MKLTRQRAPAKDRREPAEQPRQVDPESREQRQEKAQRDHPVQKPRVHAMPQQLAFVHLVPSDFVEGMVRLLIEALNRGCHWSPPWSAVPAAGAAVLPSRSAGIPRAIREARTCPAPASPATSRPCSSTEFA